MKFIVLFTCWFFNSRLLYYVQFMLLAMWRKSTLNKFLCISYYSNSNSRKKRVNKWNRTRYQNVRSWKKMNKKKSIRRKKRSIGSVFYFINQEGKKCGIEEDRKKAKCISVAAVYCGHFNISIFSLYWVINRFD